MVVVSVFMQHKYYLVSNLISPGRCNDGSLFVSEEQEGLARDIIHMAATETVMPDALMTSQTWSKWQQGFMAFRDFQTSSFNKL